MNDSALHADSEHRIFVARQPIFDRDMDVLACELLFRPPTGDDSCVLDPDTATAQVLMNATAELDIHELLGGKPAFVNFSRRLLQSVPAFETERFVMEIGEDVAVDDELVKIVRDLWGQGYLVSLDGFTPDCAREALLPYARYVRLDNQALSVKEIGDIQATLRRKNPGVVVIAEKIESAGMVKALWQLGLDGFQGYFFCKPEIIAGTRIPDNKMVVLKLISELRKPDVEIGDLDRILARDSGLSFKLLKMVNSAAFRRAKSVESVRHALTMLGMDRIRSWVSMVALCDLGDKPEELQLTSIIRARTCELIAERTHANAEQYFTLGLFSLLDAFFDKPMAELLEQINLAPDLAGALGERTGTMGGVLEAVIQQERGAWDAIDEARLKQAGVSLEDLSQAYLEATRWARETLSQMNND